jgi:hypothetical protein
MPNRIVSKQSEKICRRTLSALAHLLGDPVPPSAGPGPDSHS